MNKFEDASYRSVKAEAQRCADETGLDHGIHRSAMRGFYYFMLPRAENRSGHELRCEVVHCTDLAKCRPGHGPNAGRNEGGS